MPIIFVIILLSFMARAFFHCPYMWLEEKQKLLRCNDFNSIFSTKTKMFISVLDFAIFLWTLHRNFSSTIMEKKVYEIFVKHAWNPICLQTRTFEKVEFKGTITRIEVEKKTFPHWILWALQFCNFFFALISFIKVNMKLKSK